MNEIFQEAVRASGSIAWIVVQILMGVLLGYVLAFLSFVGMMPNPCRSGASVVDVMAGAYRGASLKRSFEKVRASRCWRNEVLACTFFIIGGPIQFGFSEFHLGGLVGGLGLTLVGAWFLSLIWRDGVNQLHGSNAPNEDRANPEGRS